MKCDTIIIGTRSSKLALWQADYVAARLREAYPELTVEKRLMTTKGDKILDAPLAKIGGKGLFTKELEQAMLAGEIDLAVHSLKDMPTEVPEGLAIAAITKRADPGDAFVSNRYASLAALPAGAAIGTSSLRRRAQLLHARPDLTIRDLRGNVNTRLAKLDAGEYDARDLSTFCQRFRLSSEPFSSFAPRQPFHRHIQRTFSYSIALPILPS